MERYNAPLARQMSFIFYAAFWFLVLDRSYDFFWVVSINEIFHFINTKINIWYRKFTNSLLDSDT